MRTRGTFYTTKYRIRINGNIQYKYSKVLIFLCGWLRILIAPYFNTYLQLKRLESETYMI